MTHRFDVRLEQMPLSSGEISLNDLVSISGSLQTLSTRVSRWVADIDGGGRSPARVAAAAALRLTGVRAGSTVLSISAGDGAALDLDLDYERQVEQAFWSMLVSLGAEGPPQSAPPAVRRAAADLVDALERAAPLVALVEEDGASVRFRPARIDRTRWREDTALHATEPITVFGRVEAVDLRFSRFRLVDDVGNRVALLHVRAPEAAAQLVGRRASATGTPMRDDRGRLVSLDGPTLEGAQLPETFFAHVKPSHWQPPDGYVSPDPHGVVDLDEEEWSEFLRLIDEQ